MIEIQCLNETTTSIPGEKSKWDLVNEERMYINPESIQVARVFSGLVLHDSSYNEQKLVEMYFGGGYSVTTTCTEELENELKKGN